MNNTIHETTYKLNTPCTIALLTDIHNTNPEPIIASIRRNHPDIICIAGDLFYGNQPEPKTGQSPLTAQANVIPLLEDCVSVATTFFSLGNHDWILSPEDLERIKAKDIHVLDNKWTEWNGMLIGGLTSKIVAERKNESQDPTKQIVSWLDKFESLDGYKLLLCHHPEYYNLYCKGRKIDLILSGHAHGGQWRFFDRGVFAPGQGLFPKLTSGVHDNLVISRGLANTAGIIPRINNPVEVVYLYT